jgi:hypothetical protein
MDNRTQERQRDNNALSCIPRGIQIHFMHALEFLWVRELRQYFQVAAADVDKSFFNTLSTDT